MPPPPPPALASVVVPVAVGSAARFRCLFATNCRKSCEVAPEELLVGTTCNNFTIDRQLIDPAAQLIGSSALTTRQLIGSGLVPDS